MTTTIGSMTVSLFRIYQDGELLFGIVSKDILYDLGRMSFGCYGGITVLDVHQSTLYRYDRAMCALVEA